MSHIPVNHHLRPLYRTLAALIGIYLIIFGAVGFTQTIGEDLFERGDTWALGLRTNLAFSIASVVAGAVIVLAVFVGRNVDVAVNLWGSVGFMVAGLAGLALLSTDLNVLNFSVSTVVVSFAIGMVLFSAGLYGKSGTAAQAQAEELVRHGGR